MEGMMWPTLTLHFRNWFLCYTASKTPSSVVTPLKNTRESIALGKSRSLTNMTCEQLSVLITSVKHRSLPSNIQDSPELQTAIFNHYWLHSKKPIQVSNCMNIHQKLDRDVAWDQDHGSATYCETCWAEMTSWLTHSCTLPSIFNSFRHLYRTLIV